MLKFTGRYVSGIGGNQLALTPDTPKAEEYIADRIGKTVYLKAVESGELRSLSKNRLLWKWNSEIGNKVGQSPAEIHALLKLRVGVPILLRDSEAFAKAWGPISQLSYEPRLKLIEHIEITSTFGVKQMKEYMDSVYQFGNEAGAVLTDPDLRWYE